jgi:YVTN family beta-propeller protein
MSMTIDVSRGKVFVTNRDSNNVSVIDAARRQLIGTVPTGEFQTAIAVDSMLGRVYVAHQGTSVSKYGVSSAVLETIDEASLKSTSRIDGGQLRNLEALAYDGGTLWVAIDDRYGNGDVASRDLHSLGRASSWGLRGVGFSVPAGKLYVLPAVYQKVGVVTPSNLAAGKFPAYHDVGTELEPHAVLDPCGGLYVTGSLPPAAEGALTAFDLKSEKTVSVLKISGQPSGIVVDHGAGRLYVSNRSANTVMVIRVQGLAGQPASAGTPAEASSPCGA